MCVCEWPKFKSAEISLKKKERMKLNFPCNMHVYICICHKFIHSFTKFRAEVIQALHLQINRTDGLADRLTNNKLYISTCSLGYRYLNLSFHFGYSVPFFNIAPFNDLTSFINMVGSLQSNMVISK